MKTLVLGASTNPDRYSFKAIEKLKEKEHSISAVGFRKGVVHGEPIDTALDLTQKIDTVSLYLGPQRQEAYYEQIISLNPRRVIFNPGTENAFFEQQLREKGIEAERACTLVLLATNQY